MIDTDKVLIGLGQHISGRTPQRCGDCPYFNGDSGYGVSCRDELLDDIYELLETREEAQEPVKPVPAIDDVGDWLCGKCYNSVVGTEELDEGGFVPIRFNYCPNCGRAVKWE